MPYRRPTNGACGQWLRPSEASELADRHEAARVGDLAVSERLGQALLQWLGLVAVLLAFGCAPEAPRMVRPGDGIVAAWCPGDTPTIAVEGCPLDVVREAADLWHPLLADASIETGSGGGDISIAVADAPGEPIGHTVWQYVGHALGFAHSVGRASLMFEKTQAESWGVTPGQLAAYAVARGAR
jgi:hypothetical protein